VKYREYLPRPPVIRAMRWDPDIAGSAEAIVAWITDPETVGDRGGFGAERFIHMGEDIILAHFLKDNYVAGVLRPGQYLVLGDTRFSALDEWEFVARYMPIENSA
jgi:hypothetical protein